MLKKRIEELTAIPQNLSLFKEERDYAVKHNLIAAEDVTEVNPAERFQDAYIEKCDKESENIISEESSNFLNQPITYLKEQQNVFIYLESKWFDIIGVDAVSLEMDDVFRTYDALLGLKLQKKYEKSIREYFQQHFQRKEARFSLMFSAEDGLWNLNFTLNYVDGYHDEMSIGDAYQLIYSFLFKLAESVEAV
ncbi:branched-chain amino acid aminotransferase [Peribacillus saganii]|uniref:Branched-chain amino acid aminotransferase n=1 Tax=Peribacillus saganii TaxID=2303992 RepID=A0A372LLF1_9BACI|nr:branched-chain amino acid aminotransferase [Peribacillus saganii]RFU67689.1 branched-chain amino acid aminotransferase [Peribacillus saganii]